MTIPRDGALAEGENDSDGDFEPDAGYISEEARSEEQDSGDEATIAEKAVVTGKRKRGATEGKELGFCTSFATFREKEAEVTTKPDVDLVWKQLNEESERKQSRKPPINPGETITITRTYEFAGKTHNEEKVVPKDSEEARVWLSSVESENKSKRPPPKKRISAIEMASLKKKAPRLNTIEKSKLDWARFVDREGISHDLKQHNKDGYVEKQNFLRRTEERQYQEIKDAGKR